MRRHHYDRAFERFLRDRRVPYVCVDEARKALLPDSAGFRVAQPGSGQSGRFEAGPMAALKSFDFVLYAGSGRPNLLVDVKGRKIAGPPEADEEHSPLSSAGPDWTEIDQHLGITGPRRRPAKGRAGGGGRGAGAATLEGGSGRMECWVTQDDIDSLAVWERLFGEGFRSAFVFIYWCERQPPDGLFQELVTFEERWYALRVITLADYSSAMRVRSPRWRTVDLPQRAFAELSQPLSPTWLGRPASGTDPEGLSLDAPMAP